MKENRQSFISQCRVNYFNKITPSNKDAMHSENYLKLVDIAKSYFSNDETDVFCEYLKDGQYFIQLWAAHLLIEYGQPSDFWKNKALQVIKLYTDNPLAPEVAREEKQWVDLNYPQLDN